MIEMLYLYWTTCACGWYFDVSIICYYLKHVSIWIGMLKTIARFED